MLALSINNIGFTIGRQTRTASSFTSSSLFAVDALRPKTTIIMPRFKGGRSGGRKRFGFGSVATRSSSNSNNEPTADSSYDMVVVGGGSAGLTAAKFASGTLKKSVLIVEEERLGGDRRWARGSSYAKLSIYVAHIQSDLRPVFQSSPMDVPTGIR